jgi:16S rRNA (cytidine1402-2'-O)-methyltransferase
MLYIVPTPIGNLKDITLRALEVLGEVDRILAEDTRVTGKLLKHYDISKPMISYHDHNEHKVTDKLIAMLQNGETLALVSDAGTPLISDPGFLLVRECLRNGIKVIPLPGPSAITAALSACGLPTDKFHFEGFLPNKKGRNKRWEFLKTYPHTVIFYESPFRIKKLIKEIEENLGPDTLVTLAREISKIYEEFVTGDCVTIKTEIDERESLKGEFVVITHPGVS